MGEGKKNYGPPPGGGTCFELNSIIFFLIRAKIGAHKAIYLALLRCTFGAPPSCLLAVRSLFDLRKAVRWRVGSGCSFDYVRWKGNSAQALKNSTKCGFQADSGVQVSEARPQMSGGDPTFMETTSFPVA